MVEKNAETKHNNKQNVVLSACLSFCVPGNPPCGRIVWYVLWALGRCRSTYYVLILLQKYLILDWRLLTSRRRQQQRQSSMYSGIIHTRILVLVHIYRLGIRVLQSFCCIFCEYIYDTYTIPGTHVLVHSYISYNSSSTRSSIYIRGGFFFRFPRGEMIYFIL